MEMKAPTSRKKIVACKIFFSSCLCMCQAVLKFYVSTEYNDLFNVSTTNEV